MPCQYIFSAIGHICIPVGVLLAVIPLRSRASIRADFLRNHAIIRNGAHVGIIIIAYNILRIRTACVNYRSYAKNYAYYH